MDARMTGLGMIMLLVSACTADTGSSSGSNGPANTQLQAESNAQLDTVTPPGANPQPAAVEITEWRVPYEMTRPRDPFVDPTGRVWFCGQGGAYLAYLLPETGEFRKFDLVDGAGPHNLIVDDNGDVWYAANTLPYIGRLDPATGDIQRFEMPAPVKDPHTLVFDSTGNIWFTAQRSNHVAKLDTRTGEVSFVTVPVSEARPYGIKVDANDRPWIALFGTNKLATVNPETMLMETFDLPRAEARPRRLEVTGDGMIWYVDYAGGMLGRLDTENGEVSEWSLPGGAGSRPYGTALDDKQTVWIAEGGTPNRLVSFDTAAQRFGSIDDIPGSKGAIRHMYFHPPTREIWFGEDSNYIGRARVP